MLGGVFILLAGVAGCGVAHAASDTPLPMLSQAYFGAVSREQDSDTKTTNVTVRLGAGKAALVTTYDTLGRIQSTREYDSGGTLIDERENSLFYFRRWRREPSPGVRAHEVTTYFGQDQRTPTLDRVSITRDDGSSETFFLRVTPEQREARNAQMCRPPLSTLAASEMIPAISSALSGSGSLRMTGTCDAGSEPGASLHNYGELAVRTLASCLERLGRRSDLARLTSLFATPARGVELSCGGTGEPVSRVGSRDFCLARGVVAHALDCSHASHPAIALNTDSLVQRSPDGAPSVVGSAHRTLVHELGHLLGYTHPLNASGSEPDVVYAMGQCCAENHEDSCRYLRQSPLDATSRDFGLAMGRSLNPQTIASFLNSVFQRPGNATGAGEAAFGFAHSASHQSQTPAPNSPAAWAILVMGYFALEVMPPGAARDAREAEFRAEAVDPLFPAASAQRSRDIARTMGRLFAAAYRRDGSAAGAQIDALHRFLSDRSGISVSALSTIQTFADEVVCHLQNCHVASDSEGRWEGILRTVGAGDRDIASRMREIFPERDEPFISGAGACRARR